MQKEETTYRYFAISVKGGFYGEIGDIVNDFSLAMLFETKQEAHEFRLYFDSQHKVDLSTILRVQILLSTAQQ